MFYLFKKKRKERKEQKEQPLQYWEEDSYIHALPSNEEEFILDSNAIDRVRKLVDVKLTGHMLPDYGERKPGVLFVEYMGCEYEFYYYYDEHEVADLFTYQKQVLTKYEMEKIQNIKKALTSYMKFGNDVRASYVLQLKLLTALMPDVLAFEDESAEKLINRKWVELAIQSKLPCAFSDLYTIQGVEGEKGDIWLHTHGLARCNVAELEILCSFKDSWSQHCSIITSLANVILEGRYDEQENYALIGQFIDGSPMVVRKISWTQGVLEYNTNITGTEKDRESCHNSKREIIFAFIDNKIYTMDKINKLLENNPIFWFSNEETNRMSSLALERFSYIRRIMEQKNQDNVVLIKLGLQQDETDEEDKKEHIWFELLDIKGDRLHLKLTQEPYYIANLHEGDEGEYSLEDLTDWIIYTEKGMISPGTAYLLDI